MVRKKSAVVDDMGNPVTTILTHPVTYRYTQEYMRTRRYVNGVGAQSCSRRTLKHLLPHTVDLDIVNCQFTIIDRLLDRLETQPPMNEDWRDIIKRCAHDREVLCLGRSKHGLIGFIYAAR